MSIEELVRAGGDRVVEHAPFGARTTYRVGGTARALVTLSRSEDLTELAPLLFNCGLQIITIGNGSNLLVADGEQEVVAVRLEGDFANLDWSDRGDLVRVVAGAGLDLPVAARRLSREGIVGFEWAVGVPGTFGGAVAMNAGGHGSDMAASVDKVFSVGPDGVREWGREELGFSYRSSAISGMQIVTGVELLLRRGDAEESSAQLKEIVRWRREHQPGGANAGSVFRNPPGDHAGRLVEVSGCKGLRVGSALVSEKHANFIIADAQGSANDVYQLILEVRRRVALATGVELDCENKFIGFEELQ